MVDIIEIVLLNRGINMCVFFWFLLVKWILVIWMIEIMWKGVVCVGIYLWMFFFFFLLVFEIVIYNNMVVCE